MNTLAKAIVTVFMWMVLGAIAMSSTLGDPGLGDVAAVIVAIAPLFLGLLGTGFIWAPEVFTGTKDETETSQMEKAKRVAGDSRMALLLEMMDEDERETFKESLKRRVLNDMRFSEDGELPSATADLWDEQAADKRLRR